jgi:hypothetical protein
MHLSNYALDKFVSQQLSQLTQCNASKVEERYPQTKYWVSNFVLNSILGSSVSKEGRIFTFFFLRRAEAAFTEYEYARQTLIEYISTSSKMPSYYFRALHHFEMTITMLWQAYDLTRKVLVLKKGLFEKGDGSKYERLNWIYNVSRHFDPSKLPLGQIHMVWLNDGGIQTDKHGVSFQELEEFLVEIGNLADSISKARVKPKSTTE